jgi:dTDP-4-dehydrorhamnose 3,5-epimerase
VRFIPAAIDGVIVIEPDVHRDARGFFVETFRADRYQAGGIDVRFVQDNYTQSIGGTIRGLHLQHRRPQGKLIRVVRGEIYDVALDLRRGSPTLGRWIASTLSAENFRQCYIPPGFAHGFAALGDIVEVEYKCTDFYDPTGELGIAWNDPALAIPWPIERPFLSERDRQHPTLAQVVSIL